MSESDTNQKKKAFYTPRELADHLNISIATLNRIISKREIITHSFERGRRISNQEVERYIATH